MRLSIVFAEHPAQPVIPRLQLLRDDGTIVDSPFDQQELWSPDDITLTVLLHPGRVKTGLVAHNTLGRALIGGEHVRLTLEGQEIASWNVTDSNSTPPSPSRWKIHPPRAGTRATLSVMLGKPIDAMARDLIAIAGPDGRRVPGQVTLSRGETRWSMEPGTPWLSGAYAVMVNAELEDSSGNRVGQPFEHSAASAALAHDTSVPFRIR
ncbi:hypothetical protein [Paraburkholderia elongata]|uniref:Bacterial Ig-like domain-containing protein n=1 Tax=Paraburkholderia elongata TaxID=2675747 RepID=A0A972SPC9_9BURK|nr:hypothetical protein [Paraburkholderia elongata]NPT62234.1 hypothetical protein [Paraburkholderia elongata]